MIIYKCLISNDEMFADTFKVKTTDDGIFFEVEGKTITRTEGFDEALICANASAEEASEGTEEGSVSGVDIVLNHKLQETAFDKKQYLSYVKAYVKQIRNYLQTNHPEREAAFVANSQAAIVNILKDIKNFQFFTGESMNPEGMVGLLNYREDGITPYMLFFKEGLLVEKC